MNPREFLTAAREWATTGAPAKRRSAISRAYYAAFHVGAETLRALGFRLRQAGTVHGEVALCFQNSGHPEVVNGGRALAGLQSLRNRADYHLDKLDVEQSATVMAAIGQAQFLIDIFERILTEPNRSQIHSTIAAWRKSNGYP